MFAVPCSFDQRLSIEGSNPLMAEDAAPKKRRESFRFHRQPIWRAVLVRDRARDGRDGRVHYWLPKAPVAVVPRSYNIKLGVGIHPLPPSIPSRDHDRPNVHFTVPWGIMAFIQSTEDRRTGIPRLYLYLVFPRASSGLGLPRRFQVESRGGVSTNFPLGVSLFDYLEQAENRVPGEKTRCDHSLGHCWKATGQL